jgi:hypothetical protein
MLRLRETETCAFLSYGIVSTMGRRCLLGALLLILRLRPFVHAPYTTFRHGPRDFGPMRRAFLRRMQLVPKVCPRFSQRL